MNIANFSQPPVPPRQPPATTSERALGLPSRCHHRNPSHGFARPYPGQPLSGPRHSQLWRGLPGRRPLFTRPAQHLALRVDGAAVELRAHRGRRPGRPFPHRVRVKPAVLATPPAGATVRPLCQSNRSSCGQTSVAMGINSLTGKRLTDRDIHNRYGFGLLQALNCESKSAGYRWHDGGNFSKKNWAALEKRLNKERTPVLMGLNGPSFSPSGRGHIVTLLSIDGQKVRYADPADGTIKVTTRRAIEQARPHPDGKFFFYAARAQ
jgi:hypothetical protein